MEIETATQSPSPCTILRIKRKRNEEPLDALVIESRSRRKKHRGYPGVFQYAQTVENAVWKDEKSQKDIQEKISQLARESTAKPNSKLTSVKEPETITSPVRTSRRYTIVSPEESPTKMKQRMLAPPKVYSSKGLAQKQSPTDLRMYDAILSPRNLSRSEPDPEMEKFLPLLQDYLKIHDIHPDVTDSTGATRSREDLSSDDGSDDYVWDVFYHRPVTLSEWNSVAVRTATLTGLPPSMAESDGSSSESEAEDEADEDSNAEEYYKNDYPEEESDEEKDSEADQSDEFHEGSDYDDIMIHSGF